MSKPEYRTELHTHSYYSLLDGLPSPTEIIENAINKGMKSIALTDHGFLGGMAEFFLQAKKNNTTPEKELHYQKLKDRYKRMLAKSKINNYYYLEIPYYTDDKDETWKKLINDKISEINRIINIKYIEQQNKSA